jgi:hypothetical protein
MRMGEWSSEVMEKWGLVFLVLAQDSPCRSLSPLLQCSNTPVILVNQDLIVIS